MVEVKLGAGTAVRIEESYEPNFDAKAFFPDWDPAVVERHRDWLMPAHYDEASAFLKLSVHSWLLKVGGSVVDIDTNHPLAGVTLNFDIEITDVREATTEELEHGHAHGPGGHHHH